MNITNYTHGLMKKEKDRTGCAHVNKRYNPAVYMYMISIEFVYMHTPGESEERKRETERERRDFRQGNSAPPANKL